VSSMGVESSVGADGPSIEVATWLGVGLGLGSGSGLNPKPNPNPQPNPKPNPNPNPNLRQGALEELKCAEGARAWLG